MNLCRCYEKWAIDLLSEMGHDVKDFRRVDPICPNVVAQGAFTTSAEPAGTIVNIRITGYSPDRST